MNLQHISNLAHKYVGYDMISKHTELPEYPVPRVHLLYTFLNAHQQNQALNTAQSCALASFLVQLGLDTHDLIDHNVDVIEDELMRSRQLKVLAGDYFSSVFYELLAEEGNVATIASMSGAICEVNRMKVSLYTKLKTMSLTAEQYLKEKVSLKMGLFVSFTSSMDKSLQNVWKLLLAAFSRLEVVIQEIDPNNTLPEQRMSYAYLKMMETGSSLDKEKLSRSQIGLEEWTRLLSKYNIGKQLKMIFTATLTDIQALVAEYQIEKLNLQLDELIQALNDSFRSKLRWCVEG